MRAGDVVKNKPEACWVQREPAAFAPSMQARLLQDRVRTEDKMVHVYFLLQLGQSVPGEKPSPRGAAVPSWLAPNRIGEPELKGK